MRESKSQYYLNIAKEVSKRSTCLKRHYGAIIVKDDRIVSTGYNGAPRGESNCCDIHTECPRADIEHNSGNYADCPAVHAEQNAMLAASREDMNGATLYLYGADVRGNYTIPIDNPQPCPICDRMIKNSGIANIVSQADEGLL